MKEQDVQKQIETLNDLIQINNDRIAGYENAIAELNSDEAADLKSLFKDMIYESRDYNEQLEKMVGLLDGTPAEGTSGAGKIYRAWMDVKALFTGGDKKTVLSNCETGEDAAQRAYNDALAEDDLAAEVRQIIVTQKEGLLNSHNKIKALLHAL